MTYKSLDERINSVAGKVVYLGDQLGRGSEPILKKLTAYAVYSFHLSGNNRPRDFIKKTCYDPQWACYAYPEPAFEVNVDPDSDLVL